MKSSADVHAVCIVYKERWKQSEWGDRQRWRVEGKNSAWRYFSSTDLSAGSHCGWQSLSCPCRLYCSGNVTYALLYIPLYFKHILPLHSAEHTAATLTFIDAWRIHNVTSVWVGSRSSLLETDDKRVRTAAGLTEVCFDQCVCIRSYLNLLILSKYLTSAMLTKYIKRMWKALVYAII